MLKWLIDEETLHELSDSNQMLLRNAVLLEEQIKAVLEYNKELIKQTQNYKVKIRYKGTKYQQLS